MLRRAASRPTGATRGRFRARGVKHSYCTGATQLGDVPRSLPIGGGTSALSAALSAIKFVCRRRRGCNTYASLRSEETFMTTHNRNHGPRACREHAKRIALIMQQKLATSAAHASHTRNTGAPRRRQNRRLRAARLRRAATCFFSAPHVPRTGTIIMPSLKAAVLALALAPAGAAKTAEETDASGLCGNQRALRNRHRHAIEQAPRRWRGGQRDDSARTRRKVLISTQSGTPAFGATTATARGAAP